MTLPNLRVALLAAKGFENPVRLEFLKAGEQLRLDLAGVVRSAQPDVLEREFLEVKLPPPTVINACPESETSASRPNSVN